jgi:hypothetical protein
MTNDERINELLEAYRPGIDKLADDNWQPLRAALATDPEVQRRAKLIQQHDDLVRSAMHDVPIPTGLAERLLTALPESNPAADVLSSEPGVIDQPVTQPSSIAQPAKISRLKWLAVAGAIAASVLLVIFFWPVGPSDDGLVGQDELVRMIDDWENDPGLISSSNWRPVTGGSGWPSYPFQPSDLTGVANRAIGPATRNGGLLLVVYDLTLPGTGKTARLYVAHTNRTFSVPGVPQSLLRGVTGQQEAIAWQRDKYLYVVVTDSQVAHPQEFVQLRHVG